MMSMLDDAITILRGYIDGTQKLLQSYEVQSGTVVLVGVRGGQLLDHIVKLSGDCQVVGIDKRNRLRHRIEGARAYFGDYCDVFKSLLEDLDRPITLLVVNQGTPGGALPHEPQLTRMLRDLINDMPKCPPIISDIPLPLVSTPMATIAETTKQFVVLYGNSEEYRKCGSRVLQGNQETVSLLSKYYRRLQVEQEVIDRACSRVESLLGDIVELGLSNGRTYDHLKERLPGRIQHAFDINESTECSMVDWTHFYCGDICETIPQEAVRLQQRVALIHADVGSDCDSKEEGKLMQALSPFLELMLKREGVLVVSTPLEGRQLSLVDETWKTAHRRMLTYVRR